MSWVIKLGSSLLTNNGQGLDQQAMINWAQQVAKLHQQGMRCVLVSSGAVAVGMNALGWSKRPHRLNELQATAAVGQAGLIHAWQQVFSRHHITVAQVLLTHDDMAHRGRYLNIRSTLEQLLALGIVPIVNENDTVSFDEIQLGDNDTLGAMVVQLTSAANYLILTDQKGLYNQDPRHFPDARLISSASADDPNLLSMAGQGSALGRGGMITKILAAQKAARAGAQTVIAWGHEPEVIQRICGGEALGTQLTPANQSTLLARKQWLLAQKPRGVLTLDDGAVTALTHRGGSLLAAGVTQVTGQFQRGDLVACYTLQGQEIARGLSFYNHHEISKLLGKSSQQFMLCLGYSAEPELIHRDNLVLLQAK